MKKVSFLFILAVVFGLLAAGNASAQTTLYVDDDWQTGPVPYAEDTDFDNYFATIQAAIDASGLGDTIFVASGTYNENLFITNRQISLIGAGAGTTIIQNSGGIKHVNIKGSGTDVELTGFTIRHTGGTSWHLSYAILVEGGAYANIHDNILDDYKKRGLYVQGLDSSANITGNTVIGGGIPAGQLQNGIVIWASDGGFANIAFNEVSGMSYDGEVWAASGIMALSTYDKEVTIEYNYVHDNIGNAIGIAAGSYCSGSYSADVTIRNNRVIDNSWGLEIMNDARGVLIEGNNIENSTNDGIDVYSYGYPPSNWSDCEEPTGTVIHYNNIVDSGGYGLWTWGEFTIAPLEPVDARDNWWGDPIGPDHPTTWDYIGESYGPNDSLGDEVSDYVLYNPWIGHGGFITGGGTIWSEKGDYAGNLDAEGVANFGFVAKYKKGAEVPEGNTNFVFDAGSLHFRSSEYDWLVVAGEMAQFKGMGTIEGVLDVYKFKIWARDGDIDTFRIKIWEEIDSVEVVVYDNHGDPLTGGNIFIHKEKNK